MGFLSYAYFRIGSIEHSFSWGYLQYFPTYLAEIVAELFAQKMAVKYQNDLPYCYKTYGKF